MEDLDHYAAWEWQPIERMLDGCNDVEVKTQDGTIVEMCSCDYWWTKDKNRYISFRHK